MNRALLLLLPLFQFTAPACAMRQAEADSLVAAGQRAYSEADYAGALAAFDSVASQYDSPALQLALGNCHFKLGDVARAVLHYERGLRLAPNDGDLRANLDLANEQVRDRIPGSSHSLGRTWQVIQGNDPDSWASNALIACLALFACAAMALLTRQRLLRIGLWVLALAAAMGLAVSLIIASMRHSALMQHDAGVVMAGKVEALAEPRQGAKALFLLHRGAKVGIAQDGNGWVEVELPNGQVGWLPAPALERI